MHVRVCVLMPNEHTQSTRSSITARTPPQHTSAVATDVAPLVDVSVCLRGEGGTGTASTRQIAVTGFCDYLLAGRRGHSYNSAARSGRHSHFKLLQTRLISSMQLAGVASYSAARSGRHGCF